MKHVAMLLSSICLLVAPTLPARASIAVDVAVVDNWQCLIWLLTDPDAHAANCGGPFHLDEGTNPLVKGSYGPCNYIVASVDLPELEFLGRVDVAQQIDNCCYNRGSSQTSSLMNFDIAFGEEIVVAVSCD